MLNLKDGCSMHLGERNEWSVFLPISESQLGFCFLVFFSHTGQVDQLNHWALREWLRSVPDKRYGNPKSFNLTFVHSLQTGYSSPALRCVVDATLFGEYAMLDCLLFHD